MKIIVLNGSPNPNGNTAAMIRAYRAGAESAGHSVTVFDVCRMNIKGCLACEYCHTKAFRSCVQQDDMQKIYPVLDEAEMIVLASPIYYHGFSGQLQCAINRIYAPGYPKKLKKAALLLSSGDHGVYDGAIFAYQNSFIEYLHLEDMGIFTAAGGENQSEELLARLSAAGAALTDPDDHNTARPGVTGHESNRCSNGPSAAAAFRLCGPYEQPARGACRAEANGEYHGCRPVTKRPAADGCRRHRRRERAGNGITLRRGRGGR